MAVPEMLDWNGDVASAWRDNKIHAGQIDRPTRRTCNHHAVGHVC